MLFVTTDKSGGSTGDGASKKRWTRPAALLAAGAVLVIFALAMVFVFTPDANRKMLDEIDMLMAGSEWSRAEGLCRRRITERSAGGESTVSTWTRTTDPAADLGLRLGVCLSMQERFEEARSVLDAALASHPKDVRLGLNRALVDYRSGDLDAALARLQGLAREATYAPNINYHIGRIYETKGLYDEALKAYRDELNISSSAGAWQQYLVLKKMRGATTTRPG